MLGSSSAANAIHDRELVDREDLSDIALQFV
jgi:hypothetical protein